MSTDTTGYHHISTHYSEELEEIRSRILGMGSLVEQQLSQALKAFKSEDIELAIDVVSNDKKINVLERSIDEDCVSILVRRQPAAVDLRMVVAATKINTDLERIGDESRKIADMAKAIVKQHRLKGHPLSYDLIDNALSFGDDIVTMLRNALDVYARRDQSKAVDIVASDRKNDRRYKNILRSLTTYMMEDPRIISNALNVIWMMRSLERIGDHSKNICEYVLYEILGADVRHQKIAELSTEEKFPQH
ncbi:MAG: phosphate signaling complex protein PhoU [Candidatus Eutrophobiaceae bacterium]